MKWLMAIPVWSTPRDSLNRFNLVFSRCPYEESPLALFLLVDPKGFEPSASRATIWRANQLRHRHHRMRPKGLEPLAHCLEGSCSIHLSYGRTLLSHGVLIWRQCAFGTRCEKYNTIRIGFCQAEFQIFLDFPAQGAFWGHSRYIPAAPRAKPSRAPAATSRT